MKNQFKRIIALVFFVIIIFGCTKDSSSESEVIEGVKVFRYQAVTVSLNNVTLNEEEYQGTFAGEQVILKKSLNNTLVFAISPNAPLGKADLIINSLNNTTIHYNVMDTVLTDTADKALAPFFGNLESYTLKIVSPSIPEYDTSLGIIKAFKSFYADATSEQKEVIAKLYKANMMHFDLIVTSSINGYSGRFANSPVTIASVSRGVFLAAVEGIVIGVAAIAVSNFLIANPALFTAVKIVGAVITGVALGLAADNFKTFINAKCKTTKIKIASIIGINNRGVENTAINFTDNLTKISPFSTYIRSVNMTDSSDKNNSISSFFSGYSLYNSTINTINQTINYINDNITLLDIANISVRSIPAISLEEEEEASQEIFNNISFTLNNPNLSLVSASLQSNGQLNIKIKIIGTPTTFPVESNLNYNYSDEFSSFSGSIPIVVQMNIVGTWILESSNGVLVSPQIDTYSSTCPDILIATLVLNGAYVFSENNSYTSNYSGALIQYIHTYKPETCIITSVKQKSQSWGGPESGGYTVDGINVFLSNLPQETINIISSERFSANNGSEIYKRQ